MVYGVGSVVRPLPLSVCARYKESVPTEPSRTSALGYHRLGGDLRCEPALPKTFLCTLGGGRCCCSNRFVDYHRHHHPQAAFSHGSPHGRNCRGIRPIHRFSLAGEGTAAAADFFSCTMLENPRDDTERRSQPRGRYSCPGRL